jgi:hypothetical protein
MFQSDQDRRSQNITSKNTFQRVGDAMNEGHDILATKNYTKKEGIDNLQSGSLMPA